MDLVKANGNNLWFDKNGNKTSYATSVTDLYDTNDASRAIKNRMVSGMIESGSSSQSRSVSAFIDGLISAHSIVSSALDDKKYNIVKHVLSPSNTFYVATQNGSFCFFVYTKSMTGRRDQVYISGTSANNKSVEAIEQIKIEVFGEYDVVDVVFADVCSAITANIRERKRSIINWQYMVQHGTESALFSIEKDWVIHQEAYPWLTKPLNDYYTDFYNSTNNILICYGPPGTGKTTFIRDFLCEMGLNSVVTYDAAMLTSDELITFFLDSDDFDVVVIEDADDLLTSDRGDNNKMIAKLLNASDGLIRIPKKKIILTTNLENVTHIDPAITRPGRCYDMVHFRELVGAEKKALAEKLGVDTDVSNLNSLAEIYTAGNYKQKTRKFGFI